MTRDTAGHVLLGEGGDFTPDGSVTLSDSGHGFVMEILSGNGAIFWRYRRR
ncbi:hypothetical protein [uncultured Methanospirillum sp.]|uniref:hypothetical protein n=1 Tax=uncultured Methanospirillum sp. TaxID=262503 RepID=UPI0029C73DBF|nr:hypothetical protein [uncultured Methanospirillum sp.]